MTELLEPKSDDVILEVGTGSGYQAAVLAQLVARVYTLEIIAPLAESASRRLDQLGYRNIEVKLGDGYYGWPQHAPYDGIVVTAAANSIPPPLIQQLRPGGRMVIPVGAPFHTQDLILLRKDTKGEVSTTSVLPVAFVPLTGKR
jgi:protein-L-isoaspartate(D-aspartate) O-methyltransferase